MKKCTPFRLVITSVLFLFNLLIINSEAFAQQSADEPTASARPLDRSWKPVAEMQQILGQEMTQTQSTLQQPNLSDKAISAHNGYLDILTRVNEALPLEKDVEVVIKRAVDQTLSENDAFQTVSDDILAKVEHLKNLLVN